MSPDRLQEAWTRLGDALITLADHAEFCPDSWSDCEAYQAARRRAQDVMLAVGDALVLRLFGHTDWSKAGLANERARILALTPERPVDDHEAHAGEAEGG